MPAVPEPMPENKRPDEVRRGESWGSPDSTLERLNKGRTGHGITKLKASPLARKVIVFNLLALVLLVVGILFMTPFRENLVLQRHQAMMQQTKLLARVLESRLGSGSDVRNALAGVEPEVWAQVYVFDPAGQVIAFKTGPRAPVPDRGQATVLTDFLESVWAIVSFVLRPGPAEPTDGMDAAALAARAFDALRSGQTFAQTVRVADGGLMFSTASPILVSGKTLGTVVMVSTATDIDHLVRLEREQILQIFLLAAVLSVSLGIMLAATVSNPLSDLAAAAELGRERDRRQSAANRVRIPDLAARPDEIGRLSVAMAGMVTALYDRIDANEQFAADVAHEIKNPLASLRSAVGSLRLVKKDEQRNRLLDVVEHDVRRLDRLVSDISNASRLDSELVKEEDEEFNLIKTLSTLCEYLTRQAGEKGVDFITDLPADPILINGREARLAQVFVNLISNAISFCQPGDAVRVWARRRDDRVLIVVEDTGPGIPEQALTKVFKRFYSERPQSEFGQHSGLGLAISKQIVKAHGGVIWAENIRPTGGDPALPPLGARFVVGLPV